MTAHLRIEGAGPATSVQDGGRSGWLRFGVTPAGPMDWTALRTANLALANEAEAAAIEVGPGGITLTVEAPVPLAFAGGGFRWTRDGQALPPAARVLLRPGERLRAQAGAWGAFACCAVPGGLDLPAVMGSRATHARSALGGLDGRPLRAGDRLAVAAPDRDLDDAAIDAPWLARSDDPIRIVLGPQDDHFSAATIAALPAATYKLTAAADRMAYRFEGPEIAHEGGWDIVSDGVALGAIQVAGDGQPMVLMADRQPTGGYTKIAHVCRADIRSLAQLRPGETCRFAVVPVAAARAALLDLEDRVAETRDWLRPLRRVPTTDRLLDANLIGGVVDGREG